MRAVLLWPTIQTHHPLKAVSWTKVTTSLPKANNVSMLLCFSSFFSVCKNFFKVFESTTKELKKNKDEMKQVPHRHKICTPFSLKKINSAAFLGKKYHVGVDQPVHSELIILLGQEKYHHFQYHHCFQLFYFILSFPPNTSNIFWFLLMFIFHLDMFPLYHLLVFILWNRT